MGCTKAIVELTGAKTYVGYGDEDSAAGRNELQWTREFGIEYTGAFEPDVIVCDGDVIEIGKSEKDALKKVSEKKLTRLEKERLIEELTKQMKEASAKLEFEQAAYIRDRIKELRNQK